MVVLTQSMSKWLWDNHRDIYGLVLLGHIELVTEEMAEEYIKWCKTEEGRKYLKGGECYNDTERRE